MTNFPLADPDSQPWWDALARGELVVQHCAACPRLRWPARAMCNDCGAFEWSWVPACGRGTVASWTVSHQPESQRSVVVMVRLDDQDDIFMPGFVDGPADGEGLYVGLPVDVGFDEVVVGTEGWRMTVLRWRRM